MMMMKVIYSFYKMIDNIIDNNEDKNKKIKKEQNNFGKNRKNKNFKMKCENIYQN